MSYDAATAAIAARMAAEWADTPVAYPNEEFDTPEPPAPFLVLEIIWTGGEQASIGDPGGNLVERYGHIWLHSFVKSGTGATTMHQNAARAAAIFEGEDFAGIVCEAAQPGGGAEDERGLYVGHSVSIPFTYSETI